VLALLGRPAVVGDVVTCGRTRIEVTAVAGRGVAEATLTIAAPPSSKASSKASRRDTGAGPRT
jgi:hypothetical protein